MATENKTQDLYTKHHASGEKFDYFMCTVSGALFAYVGQQFDPEKISRAAATMTFSALACLAISFYLGLRRIQTQITITRTNQSLVESETEIQKNTIAYDEGKKLLTKSAYVLGRDDLGRRDSFSKANSLYLGRWYSFYPMNFKLETTFSHPCESVSIRG